MRNALRKEAISKLTGAAIYIDDLRDAEYWHGTTVRSSIPRGRIKSIHFGDGVLWDEIVVVTAKDIPGKNIVTLIQEDQPFLADEFIDHAEQPVLLLAHRDRSVLLRARALVSVEVESLDPVLSMKDSNKVFKSIRIEKGNVDTAWAQSGVYGHLTVEGEYETGAQEHLYIETNGMIATASEKDGVTVRGSMQCPYYVQKALMPLFGYGPEKVRIIQTETGGGFGGKEDYPSMIAGHAALLSWKCGHPVKVVYDRAEDMVATTKRHPSMTRHRTLVSKDGKLIAMDIDFLLDGGAYATLSPVVLSRGAIHAAGPYYCPNTRITAKVVATNTPPHGAFRGFGAPQSIFALERHLDKVADAIGLPPWKFRERNLLKRLQDTATGQVIQENLNLPRLQRRAMSAAEFIKTQKRFQNANRNSHIKRGIGLATFMHGAGFTGAGELMLASIAGAELTSKGSLRILTANTEIGQGTNTILAQIAADVLGVSTDCVDVAQPDTGFVPNSGPTVASRTCMVVGKLVEECAVKVRTALVDAGFLKDLRKYNDRDFLAAARNYVKKHSALKVFSQYRQPPHIHWDDERYQGDAYGTFAWASYIAQVRVDASTFEVQVEDFVALQDVGRVVNPVLAAGQIEGGVAQGIGYALYEKVIWKDGKMANNQMTNYIIPTSADLGNIRVLFEETPWSYGPGGAKGLGELPMDGTAPAILSAVENALDLRPGSLNRIPLLPEDLLSIWSQSTASARRMAVSV